MIRNLVTFTSDMADDSIESDGEVVAPDGRGLMEAIAAAVRQAGYNATDVDQHSFYGWYFDVSGSEGRYWLMIQYPEPWLLTILDSRSIWKRIVDGKEPLKRFIERMSPILEGIAEIRDLQWFSRKEWQNSPPPPALGGEA